MFFIIITRFLLPCIPYNTEGEQYRQQSLV